MSHMDVLISEYQQRHSDLTHNWSRLVRAVANSGPPSYDPMKAEMHSQRQARLAAGAYAERWELFTAARDALAARMEFEKAIEASR